MNGMKRLMIVLMCAAAAVSVFAAGGTQGGRAAGDKTARVGAKGSLPLAATRPELEVILTLGSPDLVSSYAYADNAFTKKIVDETGVQLKFITIPQADAQQRLNMMLQAGNYPEVIWNCYGINVDMEYYAQQGILTALDPYDPLGYPNIKAAFAEYPSLDQIVRASDGKMYALPKIGEYFGYQHTTRVYYYMPWARDNNLKVPETLEELTAFLRYVKNNDLNKNGKKDEVGVAFGGSINNFLAYIARAFFPYTGDYGMDGSRKIVENFRDDNYRAALRYIAGLYKEGLIPPDAFSMTREQIQAMIRGADPVAGILAETYSNNIVPVGTERWLDYVYLLPLKTAAGQRYSTDQAPWTAQSAHYFVTAKCKDPELAIALYDYLIKWDVMLSGDRGVKGVGWGDPDPGALGFDGQPARYKVLRSWGNAPLNSSWAQVNPSMSTMKYRSGQQTEGMDLFRRFLSTGDKALGNTLLNSPSIDLMETQLYCIMADFSPFNLPDSMFVPPLKISAAADSQRIADISAVLNPFLSSSRVEFITGVRNISSDAAWAAYLAELDRLGSRELVSIRQKYIR
jgi:putative aldouronate transport system substrate-binding protein